VRLTTKGRYAVTAMLDLALHGARGPVTLADIAARQGISQSYLEQLFGRLKRARLVESLRGPGGGYALSRDPWQISVSDIIGCVGEGIDATRCGGSGDCQDGHVCITHDLWMDLSQRIDEFLSGISLGSLVERGEVRAISRRQDALAHQGGLDCQPVRQSDGRLIDARAIN
jgi:Rrf2 family iron-sulfur cluster assembly transcriptional regulator